jgi:hypothetical protein
MLITFHSKCYGDITMFGNVAKNLLSLMGHSGTVPGAILADDVPAALARLQQGLRQTPSGTSEDQDGASNAQDEDDEPVDLAKRAFPLIEMLKSATERKCAIMWD